MSEHKRNRNPKAAALALILCAAAVWITGYAFFRSENQVREASVQETYEDVLVGTIGTEDVPVIATQPQTTAPAPTETVPPTTEPEYVKIIGYELDMLEEFDITVSEDDRLEYAKATGLECLFGALYLQGQTDRLNELFQIIIGG